MYGDERSLRIVSEELSEAIEWLKSIGIPINPNCRLNIYRRTLLNNLHNPMELWEEGNDEKREKFFNALFEIGDWVEVYKSFHGVEIPKNSNFLRL